MPQSLAQIIVHIIFGTKTRQPFITAEIEPELFAYMGDTIKRNGGIPFLINGTKDHVHILCNMPRTVSLAKYIEEIKRNSSRWIKSKGVDYTDFAWQDGYGAFSVSSSKKKVVEKYIRDQKLHHKQLSFKEVLIRFFKEYGIQYDERYLWN